MTQLPYTYTDPEGDEIRVDHGSITAYATDGETAGVQAPTGPDAVALAEAALAAGGDTKHVVRKRKRLDQIADVACRSGQITMRERAARMLEEGAAPSAAAAVRALPLDSDEVDLPEEDMVEPGDEVPTLAELADRVHALEERLSPVDQRAMAAPTPAPARYRDRHGDIWEQEGANCLRLIAVHSDRREHLLTVLPHDVVEQRHGILALMPGGAR